jgi:hypothetical protein
MIISESNWGKWHVIVKKRMDEEAVTIFVGLDKNGYGLQLYKKCLLVDMYRMFPPEPEPKFLISKIIIEGMCGKDMTVLEKWVNYVTPILIKEGIDKGYWKDEDNYLTDISKPGVLEELYNCIKSTTMGDIVRDTILYAGIFSSFAKCKHKAFFPVCVKLYYAMEEE